MPRTPASRRADAIATVFHTMVTEVTEVTRRLGHKSAVDLEINFRSLKVSERGFLIFSRETKESTLKLRLATQVLPE